MCSSAERSLRLGVLFLVPLLLILLPAAALAEDGPESFGVRVEAGHSAMWYDPARSGEGWMLEVLPDDGAVVYWFTFDDEGNPRWLGGSGSIVRDDAGDELRFESLYAVHGPRFGPEFDPDDAVREDIGSAIFRFQDCNNGEIAFDAYGKQRSYPLTRLTRTMGANGCRPIHGTPGEPIQPYAGQSGSWYDPASSGQGFTLAWLANGDAALVWFTFDAEGKPYWMTAIGQPEGNKIVFPELLSVQGGRFAEAFDPDEVTRTPWGRMELALECDSGQASYFPMQQGFVEGQLDLQRLTRLESPACPWVKPKFTDLYDIAIIPLPEEWSAGQIDIGIPPPPPPDVVVPPSGERISARGVANDGTVHGVVNAVIEGDGQLFPQYLPVRLPAGATRWENTLDPLPGEDPTRALDAGNFISAEGDMILLNRINGVAEDHVLVEPVFVHDGDATPMPGQTGSAHNVALGASEDLSFVVGTGLVPHEAGGWTAKPWKWDAQRGQVPLRLNDAFPGAEARCVSNDGSVVIGGQPIPGNDMLGVRWVGENAPELLVDGQARVLFNPQACSGDAGIVFGPLVVVDTGPDDRLQIISWAPGYWKSNGQGGHLGVLAATGQYPDGWWHGVVDVSSDGSLVGGWYMSPDMYSDPLGWWMEVTGGLIWTQDTGHVLVADLLAELEYPLDWPTMRIAGVSPSGEYLLLTTGEYREGPPDVLSYAHSVLLRLTPK